jgi:ArsR family transcriptional regulator, arsenate/arsenite/antimonite-responsive transcriptional repressor
MKQYRLDQLFKALSEPTRLRLLNLLRLGSSCVCELHAVLRIPQPTASRHSAAFRHAGLVEDCRSGTRIIYWLAPPGSPLTGRKDAFLNYVRKEVRGYLAGS